MNKTLYYLYDPLCGWCYGAAPALSALIATPGVNVELLPTGLFSGQGAKPMNDELAAYAWSNDQRIATLTGQAFTERYRDGILGNHQLAFDSACATLALTAVASTAPAREFLALEAIQHARYVDGADITSPTALGSLLEALGLDAAAAMVAHPDAHLLQANRTRIGRARALMQAFEARGVPTFIAQSGAKRWMLNASAAFSDPHALIAQLRGA